MKADGSASRQCAVSAIRRRRNALAGEETWLCDRRRKLKKENIWRRNSMKISAIRLKRKYNVRENGGVVSKYVMK